MCLCSHTHTETLNLTENALVVFDFEFTVSLIIFLQNGRLGKVRMRKQEVSLFGVSDPHLRTVTSVNEEEDFLL